jgi:hypothetical protein
LKFRRDFHQNPELTGIEKRTQHVIKQYLLNLGLQLDTGIYGYSIVDILNGAKPGKKIAWRAEMDALLNDFPMRLISSLLLKAYSMAVGMIYITLLDLGIAESWQNTKSH